MRIPTRPLAVLALLFCCCVSPAQASVIVYDVTELGSNRWRYDYEITNDDLPDPITWFTVWFNRTQYGSLCSADLLTGTCAVDPLAPAGWDPFVAQPDPLLPDDGFFDLFTTGTGIANGQTLSGFSIEFTWLGIGTPGSQAYDIIGSDPAMPLQSRLTVLRAPTAVPEPSTLALLGIALIGVGYVRQREAARTTRA
jgi:PEP-CTERM motif